jgi:nicotinamidase-related amidase
MSVNPSDKGLLTPENCTVILIEHQPQMFFGVASIDPQVLLNNLFVLAKAAKIFGVPVVLTAIESKEFKGASFRNCWSSFLERHRSSDPRFTIARSSRN